MLRKLRLKTSIWGVSWFITDAVDVLASRILYVLILAMDLIY